MEQDYAVAMEWYLKAAEAGESVAMNNIGRFYEYGLGVEQDYSLAMEWFHKAADAGNAEALSCIGWHYSYGLGVEQDNALAMEWYLKGAEAGNLDFMFNAGVYYYFGQGVEQDESLALEWWLRAAEAGHLSAMCNVGEAYADGIGVEQIEIKEVSMTKEVLEKIREIDLQFYPNIGPIDWYLARYKLWHTSFVAMDDGETVGYLTSLPARKELYDAILNGVLIDDMDINPDMFLKESEYRYVESMVLKTEYRGRNIGRRLLDAYIDRYGDRKAFMIAINKAAYHLSEHYFSLVKSCPVESAYLHQAFDNSEGQWHRFQADGLKYIIC